MKAKKPARQALILEFKKSNFYLFDFIIKLIAYTF